MTLEQIIFKFGGKYSFNVLELKHIIGPFECRVFRVFCGRVRR